MTLENKKRITYIGLLLLFAAACVIGLRTLLHTNHMVNMAVLLIFATVGFGLVVAAFLVYLDRIVDWIWGDGKSSDNKSTDKYEKKRVAVKCKSPYDGMKMINEYIEKIAARGITIGKISTSGLTLETDVVLVNFIFTEEMPNSVKFDEVFGFDQATAIYLRKNHSPDDYNGDLVDYIVEQHELRRKGE